MNKLSLSLGWPVVFILTLEVICRMFPIDISPPIQPSALSGLNWEFVPNSTGQTSGNPVKINSLCLRDYEFSKDKKQNTFRILIIGSSFTYGIGLPLEKTYPKILETILNKDMPPKYYQVINAGFPEYNLSQLTAYLKQKTNQLQPDLILISLEPETFIREFIPPPYVKQLRIKPPLRKILTVLKQKLYLVTFLYNCIDNLWRQKEIASFEYAAQLRFPAEPNPTLFKDTTGSLMHKQILSPLIPVIPERTGKDRLYVSRKSTTPIQKATIKTATAENKDGIKPKSPMPGDYGYNLLQFLCDTKRPYWSVYKEDFNEITKCCQKMNIPVLLIIWPQPNGYEDTSYAYLPTLMASLIESNAITALELSTFLKGDKKKYWIRRYNNPYPNVNLHRLAAEELYKFLKELNMLN